MRDAHDPRRLKWALDWPVTLPRSSSGNNNLPNRSSLETALGVLGGAIVLLLVLVSFHSAFGFLTIRLD